MTNELLEDAECIFCEDHKCVYEKNGKAIIEVYIDKELKRESYSDEREEYLEWYDIIISNLEILRDSKMIDLEILHAERDNYYIIYSMPYYKKILLNEINLLSPEYVAEKMQKLFRIMLSNNLIHTDIALRNIAIDENNDFQWIDIDSIQRFNKKHKPSIWMACLKQEITSKLYDELKEMIDNHNDKE
jgi:hypothetical protein